MISDRTKTRFVAFVAAMSALSNALGVLVIPTVLVTLHLVQLPVVFSALAAGSVAGGLVGFFGTFVMAFTLAKPSPYIMGGNAILGFLTGVFYLRMKELSDRSILSQTISVILRARFRCPMSTSPMSI